MIVKSRKQQFFRLCVQFGWRLLMRSVCELVLTAKHQANEAGVTQVVVWSSRSAIVKNDIMIPINSIAG